jgi:hypothetical protein
MFVRPEMPLTHRDNGVSMGGSLKEVSILKNCYISADPKGRLNSYLLMVPENFIWCSLPYGPQTRLLESIGIRK